MATKDVHTLFPPPPISDHTASLGKRNFADVIKVRTLEMVHPSGPNLLRDILKSREHFLLGQRPVIIGKPSGRSHISGFEDEGRKPQTKALRFSPRASRKRTELWQHLSFSSARPRADF